MKTLEELLQAKNTAKKVWYEHKKPYGLGLPEEVAFDLVDASLRADFNAAEEAYSAALKRELSLRNPPTNPQTHADKGEAL